MSADGIKRNIQRLLGEIRDAEARASRESGSVKLLAVSKFHGAEDVAAAASAGQLEFGENRVQEAEEKFAVVRRSRPDVSLHIIGALQKNKVARAVQIASCIESVDRLSLVEEIDSRCEKIQKTIDILFELRTAEETKSGFESVGAMREALAFCAEGKAPRARPRGFMTMAPFTSDERAVRESFAALRRAAESLRAEFPNFDLSTLSMGMSGDWKIAVEEGSTEVRIGTAIFGERPASWKAGE